MTCTKQAIEDGKLLTGCVVRLQHYFDIGEFYRNCEFWRASDSSVDPMAKAVEEWLLHSPSTIIFFETQWGDYGNCRFSYLKTTSDGL